MLLYATIFQAGTFAFGQQLAMLNVTVEDPSGAAIPLASVTLRNVETGARREQVSGADGRAIFPGLAAGTYRITVESEQFDPYQSGLTLSVGQDASATIKLDIKMTRETVDVQEMAQGIDTQKAETSQVVGSGQISDLPIAGRDFIDFVLLTPNANVGRSTAVGAQAPFQETVLELSFAGLRETHSTFFGLDGVDGPAASTFANSVDLHFLHELIGFFAQGQWNLMPNLTATLGMRYDVDFFPSARDIRLNGRMHPTNFGNVQPRAGLAYSFRKRKGVVRAGFGFRSNRLLSRVVAKKIV